MNFEKTLESNWQFYRTIYGDVELDSHFVKEVILHSMYLAYLDGHNDGFEKGRKLSLYKRLVYFINSLKKVS